MLLVVHQLRDADVYRDLVRIPEKYRNDPDGKRIAESAICRVSVGGCTTLLSVRGMIDESNPIIRMDEKTRNSLGVTDGNEYDFALTRASWCGQFRWAWNASDPTPRIAARLGLLSAVLGAIGLALGIWSLLRAV